MNHGDAFAGIGGFGLAARRAGMLNVWACEIEPAARAIYSVRLGHAGLRFDADIRESRNVPRIDVLTGGFPCQDLSVAGRGAGLAGSRSGLFFELSRILFETGPEWFVFENVANLLSSAHADDFAIVLGELTGVRPQVPEGGWRSAGIAVGPLYQVAWRVLDSQYFDLAQRRERVFIVGHSGDWTRAASVLFESKSGEWNPPSRSKARRQDSGADPVATLTAGGRRGYRVGAEDAADGHLVGTLVARGAKGCSSTIDGQIVTHPVLTTGKGQLGSGGNNGKPPVLIIADTLTAGRCAQTGRANGRPPMLISQNQRGEVRTSVVAGALSSGGGGIPGQGYQLATTDAARVGEVAGISGPLDMCPVCQDGPDSPRYRGIGNAVSVPVVEWILRRIRVVSA